MATGNLHKKFQSLAEEIGLQMKRQKDEKLRVDVQQHPNIEKVVVCVLLIR